MEIAFRIVMMTTGRRLLVAMLSGIAREDMICFGQMKARLGLRLCARYVPIGFATPHVAGIAEVEPDEEVNDCLGSVQPADTMDTDPHTDPEAGGKGIGDKAAE
jgi:hypothetical protein